MPFFTEVGTFFACHHYSKASQPPVRPPLLMFNDVTASANHPLTEDLLLVVSTLTKIYNTHK
jgi:hypothetical protein